MSATSTERQEYAPKNVEFFRLVSSRILEMGIARGYLAKKFEIDAKTEYEDEKGTKHILIEPYSLQDVQQKDLVAGQVSNFLITNPKNSEERSSYLLSVGNRVYGDGETLDQIIVSKIISPNRFQNKREWLEKVAKSTVSPLITRAEFDTFSPEFPTVLISFVDKSVSISYKGQGDEFLNTIYNFFPDKLE